MPTIPDVMDLGTRPVPRRARGIVQDRSAEISADATRQFAGSIGNIAQQFGEREDKFAYAQAKSSLLQADIATRRELENDPDWGTYESRYQESMGKALQASSKGIRSNRDRALFEMDAKLDLERGTAAIRDKAKGKEIDWGRSTIDQTLEANRAAALNAPDDASRQALLMASKEAIIGAKEKGYLSEVEATNSFQAWRDSYATGYLEMQPAAKRIEMLSAKNSVADFLQPDVKAKLLEAAKRENRDLTVRRESQAQEDAIVAKFGSGPAALKAAREIDDPEVRDSTVSRIKIREAEAKQDEMEYREGLGEEALAFLNDGGKFADLPLKIKNGLKPSALNSLRSYAEQQASGGRRSTDPETLIELSKLSGDDPQKFGELDMLGYRDKLTDADFEEFVDLQRKIRTGSLDGKATGFMTLNQIRDQRVKDLFGSSPKGEQQKARRDSFLRQYESQLRAFPKEAGKRPGADDARKILDDLTATVAIDWGRDKRVYELGEGDIPDVPESDRNEIIRELQKRGKPITDQSIISLYRSVNSRPASNLLDEVYADYPALAKHGFQFMDSAASSDGRKLEFYPPGESHSPFKDKSRPGIERFDSSMSKADVFGEMLHYLPQADGRVGAIRQEFQGSITKEQEQKWLRGDYENQVRNGLFGDKAPTFAQWLTKQGGDAFFRGYLTKQYPAEAYTAEQVEMFDDLDSYLRSSDPWRK